MKRVCSVLIVLLMFSGVFADGMKVSPKFVETEPMRQSKQVAFIEWDGEEYTTDLYVSIGPSEEEFFWVVPFEEVPEDVQLKRVDANEYWGRIEQFRNDVFKAEEDEFLYGDASYKHFLVAAINPISVVIGVVTFPVWIIMSTTFFSRYGGKEVSDSAEPLKTFDFGELGHAEVFDSSGLNLREFFESRGASLPENLEGYADKKIVVFSLKKLDKETSVLASFRFKSDGRIYYPSGTTELWEGFESEEFGVYIRVPKDYGVESAIPHEPFGVVNNHANTFIYYYGSHSVFKEDIILELVPEEKPVKISSLINYYVPLQWITAFLMFVLIWVSPYFILKKIYGDWKNFWRYCIWAFFIALFLLPFFNAIYLV